MRKQCYAVITVLRKGVINSARCSLFILTAYQASGEREQRLDGSELAIKAQHTIVEVPL